MHSQMRVEMPDDWRNVEYCFAVTVKFCKVYDAVDVIMLENILRPAILKMSEVRCLNIFKYFEMIQERTVYRHKHTHALISPFLFLLLSLAIYVYKGGGR